MSSDTGTQSSGIICDVECSATRDYVRYSLAAVIMSLSLCLCCLCAVCACRIFREWYDEHKQQLVMKRYQQYAQSIISTPKSKSVSENSSGQQMNDIELQNSTNQIDQQQPDLPRQTSDGLE